MDLVQLCAQPIKEVTFWCHTDAEIHRHNTYNILSLLLTPLSAQISASNFHDLTQITQCRVCFNPKRTEKNQSARFFCALLVKAHSARGGRGVNRKHHSAERCDLRFGFQSARKN